MTKLTSMKNIGQELERKLMAVGINSPQKLAELGAKQAFSQLKMLYPQVCLVYLYALEGALLNIDFNSLPDDKKQELKAFSGALKR